MIQLAQGIENKNLVSKKEKVLVRVVKQLGLFPSDSFPQNLINELKARAQGSESRMI